MKIFNLKLNSVRDKSYACSRGFTVVEVLVVIAIIGLLMAWLLPSIGVAREKTKIARSAHNLKNIGIFVWDYHTNNDGYGGRRTNGGCWKSPSDGNNYNYYWGAMYGGGDDFKKMFHSPLTWHTVEENSDGRRDDGHKYVDYGFNGVASLWYNETGTFESINFRTARDLDSYEDPIHTIWAHDHSEPMIDGNGDVPCYAFAKDQNALNRGHPDFNPDTKHRQNSELALEEIFRNRGKSLVLWADCHVSKISITQKWDPAWYTGGRKDTQQAWEAQEDGKYTQPPPYNYSQAFINRF